MTTEIKLQIISAAQKYKEEKGLNQEELSRHSDVNVRYIREILRGSLVIKIKDSDREISPRWFKQLAKAIGHNIEKVYWRHVETVQFQQGYAHLTTAKENGTSGMLIADTGHGKSDMLKKFVGHNPQHTYVITITKLHTLPYIMEQILLKFGLTEKGSAAARLDRIVQHLRRLKFEGEKVLLAFDEAENFKLPVFGLVKALYDALVQYCAIVLIGTTELTEKMERLKRKNKDGMPQFCRRFKAQTRYVQPISPAKDFEPFFEAMNIEDKGLRQLVLTLADNYGELHDYLEPFLREVDQYGWEVSETAFRIKYNFPPNNKSAAI